MSNTAEQKKYIESMPWIRGLLKVKVQMAEEETEEILKAKDDIDFLNNMIKKAESIIGKSFMEFNDNDKINVWNKLFE